MLHLLCGPRGFHPLPGQSIDPGIDRLLMAARELFRGCLPLSTEEIVQAYEQLGLGDARLLIRSAAIGVCTTPALPRSQTAVPSGSSVRLAPFTGEFTVDVRNTRQKQAPKPAAVTVADSVASKEAAPDMAYSDSQRVAEREQAARIRALLAKQANLPSLTRRQS